MPREEAGVNAAKPTVGRSAAFSGALIVCAILAAVTANLASPGLLTRGEDRLALLSFIAIAGVLFWTKAQTGRRPRLLAQFAIGVAAGLSFEPSFIGVLSLVLLGVGLTVALRSQWRSVLLRWLLIGFVAGFAVVVLLLALAEPGVAHC